MPFFGPMPVSTPTPASSVFCGFPATLRCNVALKKHRTITLFHCFRDRFPLGEKKVFFFFFFFFYLHLGSLLPCRCFRRFPSLVAFSAWTPEDVGTALARPKRIERHAAV